MILDMLVQKFWQKLIGDRENDNCLDPRGCRFRTGEYFFPFQHLWINVITIFLPVKRKKCEECIMHRKIDEISIETIAWSISYVTIYLISFLFLFFIFILLICHAVLFVKFEFCISWLYYLLPLQYCWYILFENVIFLLQLCVFYHLAKVV